MKYFSLKGLSELQNLRDIYFEDITVIAYIPELLKLPNLKSIYIGNTDGDTSMEMILRQEGLPNSIDFIYPDGTKNFGKQSKMQADQHTKPQQLR